MSTRERVLSALAKFRPRPVDVPEFGGVVYVRPLTVAGMARIHALMADPMDRLKAARKAASIDAPAETSEAVKAAEAEVVAARERTSAVMLLDCVVDEAGARIFNDGDEPQIAAMPGHVAEALILAIESFGGTRQDSPGDAAGN